MAGEVRELDALAARIRAARDEVEAQRVALARSSLVWWEGGAADRYRALVDARRAALAGAADGLASLEESVVALASAARAQGWPPGAAREAS